MKVFVHKNQGFCTGVEKAIQKALQCNDGNTFCLGQLVHNKTVTDKLEKQGIKFVNSIDQVPDNSSVIIRAHGAAKQVFEQCQKRNITVFDATCPYVSVIQNRAKQYFEKGYQIVLIGDSTHPEIVGINGWCDNTARIFDGQQKVVLSNCQKAVIMFQTTFDIQKYEKSLQNIYTENVKTLEIFNTICYTTIDRQNYAHFVSKRCDLIILIGDKNSSNTNKLFDIAKSYQKQTLWLNTDNLADFDLSKYKNVGIISGASTPKELIKGVLRRMSEIAKESIEIVEVDSQDTTQNENQAIVEEAVEVSTNQEQEVAQEVVEEVCEVCEQPAESAEQTSEQAIEEVPQEVAEETIKPSVQQEQPVVEQTSEVSMNKDEALFEHAVSKLDNARYKVGQKVKATVSAQNDDGVFVRLQKWKQDAFLPNEEIALEDWQTAKQNIAVGDVLTCSIVSIDSGKITLSKKVIDERFKDDQLVEGIKNGEQFEVLITKSGKDCLVGHLGSYIVIVHASQIKMGFVKNLQPYIGKKLALVASADKVNDAKRTIYASHKVILLNEKKEKEDAFWNNIEVNEIVEGKVLRFSSFGAFVSVRDFDCLAHSSDLAWERINNPADVLEIGKTYEFVVLALDREKNRVSLGYKQLQPKPWETAAEKFPVGSVVKGTVARIMPFGAFVQLDKHIDGLLHISNVSWEWLDDINASLKVGDEIEVQIMEFDAENKRITLSRKAVLPRTEPQAEVSQPEEDQQQDDAEQQ